MSKDEQCAARWMVRYHMHQCRRKGAVQEDGVLWCRQHAPSAERERRERAYAAHQEKSRAAEAERKRTKRAVQYHDELVALLEEMVNTVEWEEGTERVMSTNNAKLYKLMGGTARALLAKVKA